MSINRVSMMKLVSWNVNGIRAIVKKGFADSIQALAPDVLCLQETKASSDETKQALGVLRGYSVYAHASKARKGYSGTAILSKEEPVWVTTDIGVEQYDREGRVITAEFSRFFLLNVYTPNSGQALARLDYREGWDSAFLRYVQWLGRRKPVMVCGDLNVAHREIDLARPRENYNRSAGYTQREIDGLQRLLDEAGLVDTFRHQHPEKIQYTYWNYINNSRAKNIGWRIDYFLVSDKLMPHVGEAAIHSACYGSDHCPASLTVRL